MPIFLEPQELRLFWLKSDADKPKDSRPMFECRAPSVRITNQINALIDRMKEEGLGDDAYTELLLDAILLGVSGWRNFGDVPFSRENLARLTRDELHELFRGWRHAFELTGQDLGNSSSPSPSSPEKPASGAPAEAMAAAASA